jgi:hypothetical protein
MHDCYCQEGSDKNNDSNELHGILFSDTERLPSGQPRIRRMGSKSSTTAADSVSDDHEEEAVEPV